MGFKSLLKWDISSKIRRERERFQNSDSFLGPALDNEHVCSLRGFPLGQILWDVELIMEKRKQTNVAKGSPVGSLLSCLFNAEACYSDISPNYFASILNILTFRHHLDFLSLRSSRLYFMTPGLFDVFLFKGCWILSELKPRFVFYVEPCIDTVYLKLYRCHIFWPSAVFQGPGPLF